MFYGMFMDLALGRASWLCCVFTQYNIQYNIIEYNEHLLIGTDFQ